MSVAKAYDALADQYDGLRVSNLNKEENLFLMHYLIDRGYTASNVVETGAGTGLLIDYLDEHIETHRYLGVDCSREMIAIAEAKHPNYSWSVNDMRRLPVTSASTEAVVSIYGAASYLADLTELQDALFEANRVLRSGGMLFWMVWSLEALQRGMDEVYVDGIKVPRLKYRVSQWQRALAPVGITFSIRGFSSFFLQKLPRWTPRILFKFLLWLEWRLWAKWYPESCKYLFLEIKKP